MESVRHYVLQAELARIEAEAEAKSYAIMNKADALASAHILCGRLNAGQDDPQTFEATVHYRQGGKEGCDVIVYAIDHGALLLRLFAEYGIDWSDAGHWGVETHALHSAEYPGVKIIVSEEIAAAANAFVSFVPSAAAA